MSVSDLIRKLGRLSEKKAERNATETPGERSVLDGRTAVIAVERLLGSSGGITSTGSATPFAAAAGLALNGIRAAAYLGDDEPSREANQLRRAAARHLALVAHLTCRASTSHGSALGTGHDGYHALADSGAVLLFATNVQEAADLTVAARRFTEHALVPCVVAMDEEETAGALQDLALPTAGLVVDLAGRPEDRIESPTPAQAMLFGTHRRRVPRLFDFDHPALTGALHDRLSWGYATAAAAPFFAGHLPMILDEAFGAVGRATGRKLETSSLHGEGEENLLLIAQGSAVETALAAASVLRGAGKDVPAVLAVRSISPFPAEAIRRAAEGRKRIVILERTQPGAGGDGRLARRVRAALTGEPVTTLFAGLGGTPLRADELALFCSEEAPGVEKTVYLGIDFIPNERSPYPKRQAVIDKVRRDYPDAAALGFYRPPGEPAAGSRSALSVAIGRSPGEEQAEFSRSLFLLVQRCIGKTMRSRLGTGWGMWGGFLVDSAVWGGAAHEDPGDAFAADALILPGPGDLRDGEIRRSLFRVRPGGAVLAGGDNPGEQIERIGRIARTLENDRGLHLHYLPSADGAEERRDALERLLGASAALLGGIDPAYPLDRKKLVSLRREETDDDAAPFRDGLVAMQAVDLRERRSAPAVRAPIEEEAPAAVRNRIGREGAPSESLPRFWDQVGVLYARGDDESITADPFLASGLVPGRSAFFRKVGGASAAVPAFTPSACTACGHCWTVCPDGAIGGTVLSGAEVIGRAMNAAKERGRSADALKRVLSRLAKEFSKTAGGDGGADTVGDALRCAFDSIGAKGGGPPDPKQAEAIAVLEETVGALPVISADVLGGAHLFLAVDPDRCKGCGVCIASCEPTALSRADRPAGGEGESAAWKAFEAVRGTP